MLGLYKIFIYNINYRVFSKNSLFCITYPVPRQLIFFINLYINTNLSKSFIFAPNIEKPSLCIGYKKKWSKIISVIKCSVLKFKKIDQHFPILCIIMKKSRHLKDTGCWIRSKILRFASLVLMSKRVYIATTSFHANIYIENDKI